MLAERLTHVPDLHLGMDTARIDDGVHAPESWYYRLGFIPPTVEIMLTNYELE